MKAPRSKGLGAPPRQSACPSGGLWADAGSEAADSPVPPLANAANCATVSGTSTSGTERMALRRHGRSVLSGPFLLSEPYRRVILEAFETLVSRWTCGVEKSRAASAVTAFTSCADAGVLGRSILANR